MQLANNQHAYALRKLLRLPK